ncbi:unnamed protein product [Adineta steineri]|uniref:FAD dependent oxidoreductase n=1 Tax=Adineta steineri TaxID=433720 RepID=A0A818V0W4_9BILA|nr:unnamed protein product [Adineta steineri]
MRTNMYIFILILFVIVSINASVRIIDDCELIIVGGSTAALGAVLSASKLIDKKVCLLEPTDWAGGQMTSELLSAPDFAGYKLVDESGFILDVGKINLEIENRNPLFTQMLNTLGNTGRCSVSPICSIPDQFHSQVVLPLIKNLRIYYNTVIKHITKDTSSRRIIKIDAIQRIANGKANRCRFLSEELPDWYSYNDSLWFNKNKLTFTNISYVIERSSWGEVLVLSNASFVQGLMEEYDGDISGNGNWSCGQMFTIDFLEQLHEKPVDEPANPLPEPSGGGQYSLLGRPWERAWTYRRVNTSSNDINIVAINDIIIQNRVREALKGGEEQSYGWHYWFRANAPIEWTNRTVFINSSSWTGTCHGLAKMPYLRESRRSIGIGNFLMNISTINGNASDLHGYIFHDRMCLGAYDVDIHRMKLCNYPSYIRQNYSILPYYIPLRAMTNRDIDNLIVIGKTMAQTFLVNAATRLHPVEFSNGQAGGVAVAYAILNNLNRVDQLLEEQHLTRLQTLVKTFTPLSWTINGKRYPND